MNLTEMITAVRNNLNAEGITEMFSDANITEWLNAGLSAVASRIPPQTMPDLQQVATGTAASVALPADYFRGVALLLATRKVPLILPTDGGYDPGETDFWAEHFGLLWGNTITFYPVGSVAYTLYYLSAPADMSAGSPDPEIPDMFHYAVVCYATFLGASKDKRLRTQYLELFHELVGAGGGNNERP